MERAASLMRSLSGSNFDVPSDSVIASTEHLRWGSYADFEEETVVELWGCLPGTDWRGGRSERGNVAWTESQFLFGRRQPAPNGARRATAASARSSRDSGEQQEGAPDEDEEAAEAEAEGGEEADEDDAEEDNAPKALLRKLVGVVNEGRVLPGLSSVSITSVAVGGGHAVFVARCGTAFVYGCNNRGQLGLGDCDHRCQAVELHTLKASTERLSCASQGTPARIRNKSNVLDRLWNRADTAVTFGEQMSSEGSPRCDELRQQSEDSPPGADVLASDASVSRDADDGSIHGGCRVVAAACGTEHTLLIVTSDSHGAPEEGRGGMSQASSNVRLYAFGAREALGLPPDHAPANAAGGLRKPDESTPQRLPYLRGVVAVAARGDMSCCAAPGAGQLEPCSVYAWGSTEAVSSTPLHGPCVVPTVVVQLSAAIQELALGKTFGLARDAHGDIYAWGDGTYGELGHSFAAGAPSKGSWPRKVIVNTFDEQYADSPDVTMPSPPSLKISRIACGERHALLLAENGRIFAYGDNLAGQCGVQQAPENLRLSHTTSLASSDAGASHSAHLFRNGDSGASRLQKTKGTSTGFL
eukprot:TRINITY_DN30639_c0_g2_i3.p1 TRINITY_DN30639_c0_g2~~TRINITY_DN30639_c0_g2_i3.p1  ORF type:complete len:585 (-),score=103.11 TRINITY_DN30639_c0_g2_i3:589-2343(-)